MKTRVSVIIPVYNVQEFLEECLDSVVGQTINNMELSDGYKRNLQIILVDDGSTDDSAVIAKEYADKYENIEYVYEENQGLGHARNYGCEFAQGDYIIFLDSDDRVPPKAYERMYNLAVKNDSDMTIGNVWRFNSRVTWGSFIHEIAFSGTKEVTHITESHELFYDTTAWNKLIKREFWLKHDFKFPEGILYEDIPITIPMHYLANNVSVVYENCYLWRVRGGISKSITQTASDIKNLNDRLHVMGLVDEFFDENVSDEKLILAKDLKWLKVDLMIFIDKLISVSKEDSGEIIAILQDFIENNMDLTNLVYLDEITKLKYEYLMNNDYSRFIELLNFEFEELESSNVYLKDSYMVVDCDKKISDTGYLAVDNYIKEMKPVDSLLDVSFKKKGLEIKGFAFIPGLSVEDFNDQEMSFQLVNDTSHKRMPLAFENITVDDMSAFNIPFNNLSYNSSGFKINIPYSEIRDDESLVGENRILLTLKRNDIVHNIFIGFSKQNVRNRSDLKAIMRGDNYFCTKFELNKCLIIDISPVRHRYEEITAEDNKLCIHTPEYYGDVLACYDESQFNREYKVPFTYDEKSQVYSVEIDKLLFKECQIRYENGEPLVHKWKRFLLFNSDFGSCIVNTLGDYHYDIRKYEDLTEIVEISENANTVTFKTRLHSTNVAGDRLISAKLFFKDNKNHSIYYIDDGKLLDDNELMFEINIGDENITRNLYHGFFDILVEYNFEGVSFSTPLHIFESFNNTFSDNSFNYSVYRSSFWTLRLKSVRKWSSREDTKEKRQKIAQKEYSFFRRLPINNKRIIFESMWGTKYSCNPRYLYEYIDENYPEYECIWSLKDEHIPINGNGIRVRRDSLKYFYYLATSKFFVNNVNFADHYVKREGQVEIQTMHGTPLKTLGIDVPGDFKTKKQEEDFIKKCGRWDYLTVQSDYVSDVSSRCFGFNKKFLDYGYPRTDMLYAKNNENDINELKSKIGLPLDKKIILYAPTWREKNKFELMLDLKSLKKSLSDEYVLILRLHHLSFKDWTAPVNDDFVYDLSRYDSIEELYLVSDILVTDYSSVMFDYANLDRPIILFTYDLKEYREKLRGFYIDIIENRPGPLVYSSRELEQAIVNIDEIEKENKAIRQRFRQKFNQYESGDSSEKIFNEVMLKNKGSKSRFNISDKIFSRLIRD